MEYGLYGGDATDFPRFSEGGRKLCLQEDLLRLEREERGRRGRTTQFTRTWTKKGILARCLAEKLWNFPQGILLFAKINSHKNTDEVAYTTSSKFSGPCMCMEICEIPEGGKWRSEKLSILVCAAVGLHSATNSPQQKAVAIANRQFRERSKRLRKPFDFNGRKCLLFSPLPVCLLHGH